jgi:hypothetical protein
MTDRMTFRTFPTAFELAAIKRLEAGEAVLPLVRELGVSRKLGMPALTRPRYPQRQDCWHVYYALGGPTMFARIGVMKALNRHVERVFNSDRKETHWGKQKLKRDQ